MAKLIRNFELHHTTRDYDSDVTVKEEKVSLPVSDYKGRPVGAAVLILKFTVVEKVGEEYGSGLPAGTYYESRVYKTKNGVRFGASHNHPDFVTLKEAEAYVAQRLQGIVKDTNRDNVKRAAKRAALQVA